MVLLVNTANKTVNKPIEDNLEIVDRKRDKNFIRKGIRISEESVVVCDFLDFYAGYKGINKFEFYNKLFNYSLKKLSTNVGYSFRKNTAANYGITRSFFLDKKTYDLLHKTYKKAHGSYKVLYDDYLSMGNFTELLLYLYVIGKIEEKILNVIDFDFGIKKIN